MVEEGRMGAAGGYDEPPLGLLLRSDPRTPGECPLISRIGEFWLRRSRLELFIAERTFGDICRTWGDTVRTLGDTWRTLGDIWRMLGDAGRMMPLPIPGFKTFGLGFVGKLRIELLVVGEWADPASPCIPGEIGRVTPGEGLLLRRLASMSKEFEKLCTGFPWLGDSCVCEFGDRGIVLLLGFAMVRELCGITMLLVLRKLPP